MASYPIISPHVYNIPFCDAGGGIFLISGGFRILGYWSIYIHRREVSYDFSLVLWWGLEIYTLCH